MTPRTLRLAGLAALVPPALYAPASGLAIRQPYDAAWTLGPAPRDAQPE